MGWATSHIAKLKQGETVQFRPRGNSMTGKIESGQLVTVQPVKSSDEISINNIVLCSVKGNQYLHIVKAIRSGQFLIGNNCGGINGWVTFNSIYGKLSAIQ